MPKPNDPSDLPVAKPATPEAGATPSASDAPALDPKQLEALLEVIAKAGGQFQGKSGQDTKAAVRDVVRQLQDIGREMENRIEVETARHEAAGEVARLIDVFAHSSASAAKAIEPYRDLIAGMFHQIDFEKMGIGLQLIHKYLNKPDEITEKQIKGLLQEMQETMGPLVGYDPVKEEQRVRDEIHRDVAARLDRIFKKPPPKSE